MAERRLIIGNVSLEGAGVKDGIKLTNDVRDELEELLTNGGFFDGAPFARVGLLLRMGQADSDEPEYIESEDGSDEKLFLAVELDVSRLEDAKAAEVREAIRSTVSRALLHAADRYGLDASALR